MQETTWIKDKRTLDELVRNYSNVTSYINSISYTNREGADELKRVNSSIQQYYNITERWEKSSEKMQSLEKGIEYVHNLEAITNSKVIEETGKITADFKKSYKELKDISRTNDIPLIKEKRNALDNLCYCYNTIAREIGLRKTGRKLKHQKSPSYSELRWGDCEWRFLTVLKNTPRPLGRRFLTSRIIEKYILYMEKVKDISNKFVRIKDVYRRNRWSQENIEGLKKLLKGNLLKRIFRIDDFSLYCVIRDYKRTGYYEGMIEANGLKKDILDYIKNYRDSKAYGTSDYIKTPTINIAYESIKNENKKAAAYEPRREETPAKKPETAQLDMPYNSDYYELREIASGRRNNMDLIGRLKALNTKIQSVAYAKNTRELSYIKELYSDISKKLDFGYLAEKINSCHQHILLKNSLLNNFQNYIKISEQGVSC